MVRNGSASLKGLETDSIIIESDSYGAIPTLDSPSPKKQHYFSSAVIVLAVLIGDTARGIMFPTLWLLVLSLGGTRFHQGLAVAAFSGGRIVSSPLFGRYSETHGYRPVLIACNLCIFLGTLLYISANSIWMLILAQCCIGFGAGSLGVTRSYVADHTEKADRTEYLAYLTAVQYAGFTVTPILGSALAAHAHHNGYGNDAIVNQFTLPAMVLGAAALLCTALLVVFFVDSPPKDTPDSPATATTVESGHSPVAPPESTSGLSTYDWMAIGGCVLNLSTKGTIGVFETLTVEFTTSHYNWSAQRTGATVATWGACGVLLLLSCKYVLMCISDVNLVLCGMLLMIVVCLMLSSLFTPVPEPTFYLAIALMYGLACPLARMALIGLFSKLMKAGPQGEMMGYFGSAGSLARVVFPILAGVLTDLYGDNVIFGVMAGVLLVSAAGYAYLKPLVQEMTK
ncbi:major facilitator superfamily domain-containing protein [Ochromonadaceae sp. CCMP2298]|nr:major facilitator superfamily domain-containing protein [Ochromonadaceae sp. CCMP2298]